MKLLFYTALLCCFLSISRADDASASINEFIARARKAIPDGWTVSFEKQYDWLEISRDKFLICTSALPNADPSEKGQLQQFAISFRISPKVSLVKYRKLAEENLGIQKKQEAIYNDLVRRNVSQKSDSFLPETDSEKNLVAQYESLKKSMHKLPDYYFHDISLAWAANSPSNPLINVVDPHLENECNSVRAIVESLLSKYK